MSAESLAAPPATDAGRLRFLSWQKIVTLLAACLFAWFCYSAQAGNLWCCDVESYVGLGTQYLTRGLFVETSGTRLYGYPALVAAAAWIAGHARTDLLGTLYLLQLAGYLLGAWLLARRIWERHSRPIGDVVFYALLANVSIYPYLTIPLADGAAVDILLFCAYLILRLYECRHDSSPAALSGWASLGFLLGFAVMVRPANISWILIVLPVCVVVLRRSGLASVLRAVGCLVLGYAIAVLPQIHLNWEGFGKLGFLPPRDIGGEQLQWGMDYLKYGTSMSPDLAQMIYRNPWAPDQTQTLAWYASLDGMRTLSLRLFAAIDLDYFFPYVRQLQSSWKPLLFLVGHSTVYWCLIGYFRLAFRNVRARLAVQSAGGLFIQSLSFLIVAWLGVHFVTAVENRFVLPLTTMMLPLGVYALLAAYRSRDFRAVTGYAAYLTVAWFLSAYLASLRT